MEKEVLLNSQLKDAYSQQYSSEDPSWRNLSAELKSDNIIALCSKRAFKNMLDVGSGDGAVLEQLEKKGFSLEKHSIEISSSGVEKIKARNLKTLKEAKLFDGYTIPFPDKKFELATCSHVIEHVEHPRLLLREIARVSEYQYLEVPIDFQLSVDHKVEHMLSYGHINIYTPSLFRFLLKTEGFEILDEKYVFYSGKAIDMTYKNQFIKKMIVKFKLFLIRITPLRKIKPDAYGVLCKSSDKKLNIF